MRRIACSILLGAAAVAAVACGGEGKSATPLNGAPDAMSPAEHARYMAASYSALADDYHALCDMRRAAFAETDDDRRRERLATTDSLIGVLSSRSRALDGEWWRSVARYRERCDGSFTEFCRAAGIDSARVETEVYDIYESLNY